jgi:hypothetical protein
MEESWKIRNEPDDAENGDSDVTGTLLPVDEFEHPDGARGQEHGGDSRRTSWRSLLWMILGVVSVLTGRGILTAGFRESIPSFQCH